MNAKRFISGCIIGIALTAPVASIAGDSFLTRAITPIIDKYDANVLENAQAVCGNKRTMDTYDAGTKESLSFLIPNVNGNMMFIRVQETFAGSNIFEVVNNTKIDTTKFTNK